MESHAAIAVFRLEGRLEAQFVELAEHALQQAEIHPADEFGVGLRQLVERTVPQRNCVASQLRRLVTRLNDRVASLETIATDPAERTAREIEALRTLPPAEGDSDR